MPDGRIAFNRNGILMVLDADGSGLASLPGPIDGQFPAWQPATGNV